MKNKIHLGEKGQLSIFFATNLIVVITFIALIINVGMFVRAKINLQNAVDSAAWAGAAVQSRQLTNIAYLNWEMRNIYKEWMYKYYILGNLQIKDVEMGPSGDVAKFTMSAIDPTSIDSYNFPSVCIEFGGTGGAKICRTYQVPGIPQFDAAGVPGVDQATQAFVNAIEEQKNLDCARRSNINFLANNLWAYNVTTTSNNAQSLAAAAPNIASDRMGAWPLAFEMAIRMRNLEYVVNKKPYTQGVCYQPGSSQTGIQCSDSIENIQGSSPTAGNERIFKAFMSAYRNLGTVERSDDNNEMRASFTLTELPVKSILDDNQYSTSNLLIPNDSREKYYLDLKLMLVNFATFYTAFVTPPGGSVNTSLGNVSTSSGCDATKIALPVPGYPMGFVKNPEVITYYAVKGEVDFVGLFNPFNPPFIKLTAYAAAKPFGGRIGPNIFNTKSNASTISSRSDSSIFRSSAYISGLDLSELRDTQGNIVTGNDYVPGAPIPANDNDINFWVNSVSSPVGGWITPPDSIRFGIPNLPYDYITSSEGNEYNSPEPLHIIKPGGDNPTTGLYQSDLLQKLRSYLNNIGGNVGPNDINEALLQVRAPTKYEAFNYLIPLPDQFHKDLKVDSYGEPDQDGNPSDNHYTLRVYAPLVGDSEDYLYHNTSEILAEALNYIKQQKPAIDKYRHSMNIVAKKVSQVVTGQGAQVATSAAKAISDIDFSIADTALKEALPTCASMAGKFVYFYLGSESGMTNNTGCPQELEVLLQTYWAEKAGNDLTKDFYDINYSLNYEDLSSDFKAALFSAYRPGRLQGANDDGMLTNPYTGITENMIRNFYSTKLVSLRSVSNQGENFYNQSTSSFPTISEGNTASGGFTEINQETLENFLNLEAAGLNPSDIDQ